MKFFKIQQKRLFFASFFITFLVIIMLMGFLIAEKNIKQIAFDDSNPFFCYQFKNYIPVFLKIHFPGCDLEFNFR